MPAKAKGTPEDKVRKARNVRQVRKNRKGREARQGREIRQACHTGQPAKETPRAVRRSSAELHFTETTIIRGEAASPARPCHPARRTKSPVTTPPDSRSSRRKRFSIY